MQVGAPACELTLISAVLLSLGPDAQGMTLPRRVRAVTFMRHVPDYGAPAACSGSRSRRQVRIRVQHDVQNAGSDKTFPEKALFRYARTMAAKKQADFSCILFDSDV